jgi:SHS2 domain-containing protein
MANLTAGFRELEHTADWELEAWAPDLAGLLEQAARGMYNLAGVKLHSGPRQAVDLHFTVQDFESLLVAFLTELLWLGEKDGLGFDRYQFRFDVDQLEVKIEGAPIAKISKEIKAVTYHRLAVLNQPDGLRVRIVLDV